MGGGELAIGGLVLGGIILGPVLGYVYAGEGGLGMRHAGIRAAVVGGHSPCGDRDLLRARL